jgi:transcriptional regulator with XRE-family HTH domain
MKTNEGQRIILLMQHLGLSQKEFAKKLGVSSEAVRRWKTNLGISRKNKEHILAVFPEISREWIYPVRNEMIVMEPEGQYLVCQGCKEKEKIIDELHRVIVDQREVINNYKGNEGKQAC